jgi:hypothetical protein
VKNSEGKISRSICLNEQSIPFIPHIKKINRKNEYRVIQDYITYDFETVMKKETHKISDKTSSYVQQIPLSVTYCINNDSKTAKFIYQGENTNQELLASLTI